MRRTGLVIAAALCLLCLTPWPATAEGSGVVQGRVVNGTPGGGATDGLAVTLLSFQGDRPGQPVTTRADAQGRYRFANLATDADWSYQVRVAYRDVIYAQEAFQFLPDQGEVSSEVAVYETTRDDPGIGVERAHLFLTISGTQLSVTELHVFSNPADRTYVGREEVQGRSWTSRFVLPKDAHDLALEDGSLGGRFLETKDGFVDTEPLWPGRTSVMFSYVLDCNAGACALERTITHATANLNAMIPAGAQVQSRRLSFAGEVEAQGARYLNYLGQNLAAGQTVDLRVSLAPSAPGRTGAARAGTASLPWIILGVVLAVVVLGYPYWRRRVLASALGERDSDARTRRATKVR